MKTSDPVRSTEEDRPAPETVSSRDTQKADETAAREKEPASPAAKEAPRERNPEEVRKPNVTVSLKDEISRHFEIIPYSLRENIIPLLNQCSTVHEIKILNDFFNLYLNLSRPEQIQLVHTLVRQIVVQGREVPAELIERLFAEEKGGQSQMPETRMPEGNVSETLPLIASEPKTQGEMPQKSLTPIPLRNNETHKNPDNRFKPLLGSHPLQEMVSALPPKVSGETRNLLIQIASTPASPKQMDAFAKKILSLKDPSVSVEKILNACNHPSPRIRLAIVALIKHLAQTKSAKEFNQVYLPTLKAMARNRQSILVQAEAIKVLVDIGHRQKKSREEMEALLKEIDLIPRISDLLRKDPAKGLALLLSVFDWLSPDFQKRFAGKAWEIASKRPARPVMEKALRVLRKAERNLGSKEKMRPIRKGFDSIYRSVAEQMYLEGSSNYAGIKGN